jgi:hypothetical protein
MAPWAFLLPLAAGMRERNDGERALDRLAWVWIVTVVVFFSLSASKRSPYILPVAPAVAVLAAAPIERLMSGTLDRMRTRIIRGMLAVAGATLVATSAYLHLRVIDFYPAIATPARAISWLTAAGGLAVIIGTFLWRRWPSASPAAFAATITSIYLIAGAWALPAANVYKSARPFCLKLQALVAGEAPLRSYRFWSWRASYAYYADRSIENIGSPGELERYWGRDEPVFLLVERARIEEVRSMLDDPKTLIHDRIGSNEIYLLTNR